MIYIKLIYRGWISMDLKFRFSIIGLIVFILPMIINVVYFMFPPLNTTETPKEENAILSMIEQGSRILFAILICILVSNKKVDYQSPMLYLSILFLVLYYIVWLRYFIGMREERLLGESFLFVPMPLAVFPVLYFLFAALWLHNYPAAVIMIIFGVAHNMISYQSFH